MLLKKNINNSKRGNESRRVREQGESTLENIEENDLDLSSDEKKKKNVIKRQISSDKNNNMNNSIDIEKLKIKKKKGTKKKKSKNNKKLNEMDNALLQLEQKNKEKILDGELYDLLEEIEKSDTNDSSSVRITKEKTNNLIKVFNLQTPTIHKKRGRKPKDGNENLKTDEKKLSRKYDMDDIMIKNQIAYINFIMEFVNCILKHFNINDQFKKIDYSEKKKANFEYFKELKNKKLYELLIIKESKRYKNIGENHNYKFE